LPLNIYLVLHYIQEELSDAKNEDEIKEAVGRTCDKFPSSMRGQCHGFVNLYGDAIIALLVQEIDPRELCPQLKMCPTDIKEDVDIFLPMEVQINEKSKPTCPLCVLVVQEAQQYIVSAKTKDSVKKALERVCSRLPPKPQIQCTDFVETYYDELLAKLVQDFSAKQICEDLKLCPAIELDEGTFRVGILKANDIPYVAGGDIETNEIADFTANGQPINARENIGSGECMLCSEVVSGAENKITKGMKKQQIEEILLRECSRFSSYKRVCDGFVQQNADKIYEYIQQGLSPKQVCQQLGLCSPRRTHIDLDIDEAVIVNVMAIPSYPQKYARVPLQKTVEAPKDDPQCVVCEFVMSKLEEELKDKSTQDEIRTAVENICSKLPSSFSKKCTKFVDQYGDLIISLIDTVPPKELCSQMGMCPAQKIARVPLQKAVEAPKFGDDPQCVVCEFVMTKLEEELKDKSTQDEIRTAVENICTKLPNSISKQCTKFVEQYANLIISLIDTVPPKEICSQMGMCPAQKKKVTMLGANECTYGPSHWCSDPKIAAKCKVSLRVL